MWQDIYVAHRETDNIQATLFSDGTPIRTKCINLIKSNLWEAVDVCLRSSTWKLTNLHNISNFKYVTLQCTFCQISRKFKNILHYHTTIWLVAYFVWSLKQCHSMSDTTGIPCFIFSSYELIMQIPFQRLRIQQVYIKIYLRGLIQQANFNA